MAHRRDLPVRLLLAALLLLAATASPAWADDWPQWRGPERDGISSETGLLTQWGDAGPKVLWKKPLGEGYSGISEVGGRLYTLFSDRENEYLVSLDADSGKELWRIRLDERWNDRQGNGPRSTPTVDDGVVYALGARSVLVAADAKTGKELWRQDLKKSLGARIPTWGVSTSPLIEGNLLLLDVGGRPGASMAALQKRTGIAVWTSGTDLPGYSAPLAVTIGGLRQVLFFTGTRISSVSPEDGTVYWSLPWKTDYDVNAATPIFLPPDRIFVSSGYDNGSVLLRVKVDGKKASVEEIWKNRTMKNQFSSSVLHDGTIYGFDNRTLKAIDAATGEDLWRARGFGHGSLTYADGHLIVLGEQGTLLLVEATGAEYREKARTQIFDSKCWTVPTLADGRLFLRDESEILALDVAAPSQGGKAGK